MIFNKSDMFVLYHYHTIECIETRLNFYTYFNVEFNDHESIIVLKTLRIMIRIWLLCYLVAVFTGCKKQTCKYNEHQFVYPVNIDIRNNISVFDLFDSIEVIPLETQKESLIAWGIPQIYKNQIYILENRLSIVLCFDLNGKFLFRIDNTGRGPSEYQALWSLSFDPFNERLLLLETSGAIHEYTLDGHFIQKINPPKQLASICEVEAVNKDTLLYYTRFSSPKIHFYSRQTGKIVKDIYEEKEKLNSSPHLYHYNNQLYFLPSNHGNTVFNISDTELKPNYFWDFGKYNYNPEKLKLPQINEEQWKKIEAKWKFANIPYSFGEIYENDTYCYLLLNLNHTANFINKTPPQQVHLFYNKHTGNYFIFDDFKEKIEFGFTISMDNNYMNCSWNFIRKETLFRANILREREKEILQNMKEDDNMCIVRFRFKKL